MSVRLQQIRERRTRLISHAAAQREQVSFYWEQFTSPVERVQDGVGWLIRFKWPLAAAGATVFLFRPVRKVFKKVPKAFWSSWLTIKLIKGFLK